MPEERDTVTEVLQIVVTVEKGIESCLDHEEWRQEIMYAINYKAGEKHPEQAKEKGFFIQVGITNIPRPCDLNPDTTNTCCAECITLKDPKLCQHQCNPLRDNDVDWEDPSVCAFYNDKGCSTE